MTKRRILAFVLAIVLAVILILNVVGCKKKEENIIENENIVENNNVTEIDDILEDNDKANNEKENTALNNKDIEDKDKDENKDKDTNTIKDKDEKEDNTQGNAKEELNIDMWVKSNVNFRIKPDTNGDIIKVLNKGTKVKAIEKTEDNWYLIDVDNQQGYVSGSYISEAEVAKVIATKNDSKDTKNTVVTKNEPSQTNQKPKTEPKKETPKVEKPKKETPKSETPKKEEPKKETPKPKEEPKKEEPKKNEPPRPLKPGETYDPVRNIILNEKGNVVGGDVFIEGAEPWDDGWN